MLVDAGAHVIPVMTESAQKFVGRATFDALASEPVRTSIFDDPDPIPHTTLGQTADLIVVAPATARSIGSYATGISNDLLTAILVATRAPVVVCPAMHTEMWEHAAVQNNLETLKSRGVTVVAPEEGRLAGGDSGSGRLAAPEKVFEVIKEILTTGDLNGRKVVVTAGCYGTELFTIFSVSTLKSFGCGEVNLILFNFSILFNICNNSEKYGLDLPSIFRSLPYEFTF